MRFISYRDDRGEGVGLRDGDGYRYRGLPVSVLGGDLKSFLTDTAALAADLKDAPFLAEYELLPIIPNPDKILCIGLNYVDHSAESGFEPPAYPTVFARFANSLVAHGAALVRPNASTMFDYECELVIVIGQGGRHIAKAEALQHVAGYSLCNDGSVRDYQIKSPQWTMGKVWDGTGALGPELVTPDELPEGCRGLKISTRLNGEVLQSASISDMIFDVATLVATLSEAMTLNPGDVIISGTPGGVGAMRQPQIWLKPGDECVIAVDQIGELINPVVQEGAA